MDRSHKDSGSATDVVSMDQEIADSVVEITERAPRRTDDGEVEQIRRRPAGLGSAGQLVIGTTSADISSSSDFDRSELPSIV